MVLKVCSAAALVACLALGLVRHGNSGQPRANLALHRPVTLSPAPNYPLCTDDGDAAQLTDGLFTKDYFWTQLSTVGWQNARPVRITVDLGSVQPITGASYSTAAGRGGVEWPDRIALYVSDDGVAWWPCGDLVDLSSTGSKPPAEEYATHRYQTDALRCRGRYVAFIVSTPGPYIFCDEVEAYRGDAALLSLPRHGAAVTDTVADFLNGRVANYVLRAIQTDADAARTQLAAIRCAPAWVDAAKRDLGAAAGAAGSGGPGPGARLTLPYSDAHRRVLRARAAAWRAQGLKAAVWQSGPWDPLAPGDTPPRRARKPAVSLRMLRGERRGAVINVTNAQEQDLALRITVSGMPGGATPDWLTVSGVAWTATNAGPPVASALPGAGRSRDGWTVDVPSGMTRQVWFCADSYMLPPGRWKGSIRLEASGKRLASVPLALSVSRVVMERPTLSLGGWDYTHSPSLGITKQSLPGVVQFLQQRHVDAPWAGPEVMPFGTHDAQGHMVAPPSTALMDRWLARWPDARFYFVFANLPPPAPQTAAEKQRISEWISFWVRHLASRYIQPGRLGLLITDEPRNAGDYANVAGYGRVIKAAQPGVVLFEDPIPPTPAQAGAEMLAVSDILCPNRTEWITNRAAFERVYLPQQKAGKRLAFYSCSGPVRSLDPYSYHRLQAWDAFRYGAVHIGYWSFADAGGGSSWNEPAASGTGYSPQFLDPEGCTTSKHMEAIREGLYDYQTLVQLRGAADKAERAGRHPTLIAQARSLLTDGVRAVVEARDCRSILWKDAKDRTAADKLRIEAIELLEKLSE
ncbi:MAG: discoidin domain-containing protein [Armatimonadetes bacterium]|nr:discoidin domain-containing protein [Armatimonadota bacterium]